MFNTREREREHLGKESLDCVVLSNIEQEKSPEALQLNRQHRLSDNDLESRITTYVVIFSSLTVFLSLSSVLLLWDLINFPFYFILKAISGLF